MRKNPGQMVLERRRARQVFDVEEDYSREKLRKIYHEFALKNHPDKNPDNTELATREMVELTQAYRILLTPESEEEKHIKQFYEDFII